MSRYEDAGLFALLAVAWGAGFSAIEIGLASLDPLLFGAFRFDVGAGATLLALVALGRLERPRVRADWAAVGAGALLMVFGNVFFLFVGQLYTTGSVASVVYSLNPVLTAAFAAVLLSGAALGGRDLVGIVLGLVGVLFIARPSPSATPPADAAVPSALDPVVAVLGVSGLGALLVFGAVLSVASGSVLIQRADASMGSLPTTAWAMAAGAVLFHVGSLAAGESQALPAGSATLGAVAYLGVVGSSLGYGAYFVLLKRRGPFTTNLVNYAIPLVATITGWALLGETLAALSVVGFGFIIAGFLVLNRRAVASELRALRR